MMATRDIPSSDGRAKLVRPIIYGQVLRQRRRRPAYIALSGISLYLHRRVRFNVFLFANSIIGAGSCHKIHIVPNNTRIPRGPQELRKGAVSRLIVS